jgi:hypothetical protein
VTQDRASGCVCASVSASGDARSPSVLAVTSRSTDVLRQEVASRDHGEVELAEVAGRIAAMNLPQADARFVSLGSVDIDPEVLSGDGGSLREAIGEPRR